MTEYIDREAAIEAIMNQRLYYTFGDPNSNQGAYNMVKRIMLLDAVKRIPAADVRPVVRGTWRKCRFSEDVYGAECSVCHTTWDYGTNFCPNCGSRMEES